VNYFSNQQVVIILYPDKANGELGLITKALYLLKITAITNQTNL
jgi:hypothetical protein